MKSFTHGALMLVLLFVTSASIRAETTFDAAARAKAIAPFIEEETVAVVHVDLSHVDWQKTFDLINRVFCNTPPDIRNGVAAEGFSKLARAGYEEFYIVAALDAKFMLQQTYLIVPIPLGMDEKTLRQVIQLPDNHGWIAHGALVTAVFKMGSVRDKELNRQFRPVERLELKAAFEAAGDTAAQIVLIPPRDSRRVIEELYPQLPKELGGGPSSVFTRGVAWAAMGINAPPQIALQLVLQSQDAQAAEALHAKFVDLSRLAAQLKPVREAAPKYDEIVALLTPTVEGDRLMLSLKETSPGLNKLLSVLTHQIEMSQTAAAQAVSMDNFKRLALDMCNFEQQFGHFPQPVGRSPDGKPLLSWRVGILPYIDNNLYKQFHLDEPWDSAHNRTLIDKMPGVFRQPLSKAEKGKTNYVIPVGKGTAFSADRPLKVEDITSGTSNTIMIIEVDDEHAVTWTKPDDWQFDRENPSKGLGRFFRGNCCAGFCDGSAHCMRPTMDPKVLRSLICGNADAMEVGIIDWNEVEAP